MSYHYVRDTAHSRFNRLNALSPIEFVSQLALLEHACDILTPARLLSALDGTGPLEGPSALLTFDDGLIDHYTTVFPILRARGVRAIFFVSHRSNANQPDVLNVQKVQLLLATLGGERLLQDVGTLAEQAGFDRRKQPVPSVLYRYDAPVDRAVKQLLNYELPYEIADAVLGTLFERHVGREEVVARELYLTEGMIREMSGAGMTFGFHTCRHRVLSRLSVDLQRIEIADGIGWIRDLTGQSAVPFCYPHGHVHAYTADTVDIVRRAGYSMACTAVRAFARPPSDSRFELPRYDTRDVEGAFAGHDAAASVG